MLDKYLSDRVMLVLATGCTVFLTLKGHSDIGVGVFLVSFFITAIKFLMENWS